MGGADLVAWLFGLLMAIPPSHGDTETAYDRVRRMWHTSIAIVVAGRQATCDEYPRAYCTPIWPGTTREIVTLVYVTGRFESAYAQNVHEGRCRDDQCDAERVRGKIHHRARSPFQLQHTGFISDEDWLAMLGSSLQATHVAAWNATRILSYHRRNCGRVSIEMTVSTYARGHCKLWGPAYNRARTYRRLLASCP